MKKEDFQLIALKELGNEIGNNHSIILNFLKEKSTDTVMNDITSGVPEGLTANHAALVNNFWGFFWGNLFIKIEKAPSELLTTQEISNLYQATLAGYKVQIDPSLNLRWSFIFARTLGAAIGLCLMGLSFGWSQLHSFKSDVFPNLDVSVRIMLALLIGTAIYRKFHRLKQMRIDHLAAITGTTFCLLMYFPAMNGLASYSPWIGVPALFVYLYFCFGVFILFLWTIEQTTTYFIRLIMQQKQADFQNSR